MKSLFKKSIVFFLVTVLTASLSLFSAIAEDTVTETSQQLPEYNFKIELSMESVPSEGGEFNLICNIKDITAKNGLMAVSFQLDYNIMKVKPVVIAENPEDCTPYDAFMIKSPQYIMDVNGTEVSASCYENISRCYYEGCFQTYYDFKFLDKISYPLKKQGTEPDPVIRNDGDFVLSIPFILLDDAKAGDDVYFYASMATGTDAGNETEDPGTVLGTDCLFGFTVAAPSSSSTDPSAADSSGTTGVTTSASVTASAPSESAINTEAAESRSTSGENESAPSESTVSTESPREASENSAHPSTTEDEPTDTAPTETPKTSDNGISLVIILSIASLTALPFLKKQNR